MDGDLAVVLVLSAIIIGGIGHTWWWAKRENRRLDAEADAERRRSRPRAL